MKTIRITMLMAVVFCGLTAMNPHINGHIYGGEGSAGVIEVDLTQATIRQLEKEIEELKTTYPNKEQALEDYLLLCLSLRDGDLIAFDGDELTPDGSKKRPNFFTSDELNRGSHIKFHLRLADKSDPVDAQILADARDKLIPHRGETLRDDVIAYHYAPRTGYDQIDVDDDTSLVDGMREN